jgi:hypothetical protein
MLREKSARHDARRAYPKKSPGAIPTRFTKNRRPAVALIS